MKTLRNILVIAGGLLAFNGGLYAQAVVPAENFIPGNIKLLRTKDDKTFLIYSVNSVVNSVNAEKIIVSYRSGTTPWKTLPAFNVSSGSAITDVAEINGRFYISGDFGFVDNVLKSKNCIAEYLPREKKWGAPIKFLGSIGGKPLVKSLAVSDDKLYMGGDFQYVDNLAGNQKKVNYFCKYDTLKWVIPFSSGTNFGADGIINEIATDATGNLFVGGAFSKIAEKQFKNVFFFNVKDSVFDGVGSSFKSVINIKYLSGYLIINSKIEDTIGYNRLSIRNSNNSWNTISFSDSLIQVNNAWILNSVIVLNCINKNKGRVAGMYKINSLTKSAVRFIEQLNKVEFSEPLNNTEIYLSGNLVPTILGSSSAYDNINFGKLLLNHTRFTGRVYWDANQNGSMDISETGLPNFTLQVFSKKLNFILNSDKLGFVSAVLPIQQDSFYVKILNNKASNNLKISGFRTDSNFNKLYNLGVTFKRGNNFDDIKTNVTSQGAFNGIKDKINRYKIRVENNGFNDQAVKLVFNYPSAIQSPIFSVTPSSQSAGKAVWNLSSVNAQGNTEITMLAALPSASFTENQQISFSASATVTGADDLPDNNKDSLTQVITNTNNLIAKFQNVQPSDVDHVAYLNPNDGKIDYVIRFSNPTDDTITTVTVSDTIAIPDYVTYTEEIGSSHPYSRTIYTTPTLPDKIIMAYTFSNIKLHPNTSANYENSSAVGYISLRVGIDPSKTSSGEIISNRASVYLDNNAPILTNTVSATINKALSVKPVSLSEVKLYPNPASDYLTLVFDNSATFKISVFNTTGQELINQTNTKKIDLTGLQQGLYFVKILSGNDIYTQRFIKR